MARRLVGAPAERLAALSEAVAEAGRYEVASRLAAARREGMAAEPDAATRSGEVIAAEDLRVLKSWFQGREGVHATESVDRAGHRSFVPVQRPILTDDWRAHLRGERTLALPLVRAGDTALLGVLDVDLEGCHVLGYLAQKSERTSYLNHRERWSLLCGLGHLGEEGRVALHAIIGHTYNYRREVTERNIERLPPWPISCPKLRELHPEAAAVGTCSCQFDLRGRGYPTPVLYALRPSEVPAFRQRTEREPGKREGERDRAAASRFRKRRTR